MHVDCDEEAHKYVSTKCSMYECMHACMYVCDSIKSLFSYNVDAQESWKTLFNYGMLASPNKQKRLAYLLGK